MSIINLQIKADIETKGEFINGLIDKVLVAAYTDIEDVLKFVDWLDSQLSSLVNLYLSFFLFFLLYVHQWKELVLRQSILGVVGHIMLYNVEDFLIVIR